ncbi:hypothetical protein [Pseudalkalibacillus decolorationis]|uniref:hypothetical protein n=1 Tax=Pseudalkalibacillus decolorationis TaxID=163879 RepID=UPI00214949D9|nr:hypothetical protein [Pseudalkalibacillus decolorationis]
MSLPAIDLGLMAEHLATHEGMISKLKHYHSKVTDGLGICTSCIRTSAIEYL